MNKPTRDEIYFQVSQNILKVPSLPDDFSQGYLSYFTHRVSEIYNIWCSAGVTPEHLTVMGGSKLLSFFSHLREIEGVVVDYVVNPIADYASPDGLDQGTFQLEFSSLNPVSVELPPAVGVAYPFRVSEDHYHARWIFQVIDGMDFSEAERAASAL
jgi:hypothetical protein